MIVEDEGIVALQLKTILQQKGYDVVAVFASGEEALNHAVSLRPDLILMDLKLQGALDGMETAQKISDLIALPVIYLTAHSDATTVARAQETAPYGYVLKPFDPHELHIAIQLALSRHALDREKEHLVLALKEALDSLESKVQERTAELSDANAALRALLKQRASDLSDMEEKVLANIRKLVMPCLDHLKSAQLPPRAISYISLLESNLRLVTSGFTVRLSSKLIGLTQKELEVAAFIRDGKSTKEIQELLGVSKATIDSHRNHIRAKLGIKNGKINLRSYLLSIQ